MPFFTNRITLIFEINKCTALQARVSSNMVCGKRVLSSASQRGSLTVEAALALSLFVFASVCLMLPMKMLDLHRRVQAAMETAAEAICQYSYLKYRTESSSEKGDRYDGILSELMAEGYLRNKIMDAAGEGKIESLTTAGTRLMEDGEHVELRAEFRFVMPFSVLRLNSVPMSAGCVKRAWIGRDGGRGLGVGAEGEGNDRIVYVGRNRSRYHVSRECHYLSNQLRTVSWDGLDNLRNDSGGRYRPCRVCGSGEGGTVYLMESGDSYHRNRYCSSIIAYVEAVPLSQVEYLGACSYCGK